MAPSSGLFRVSKYMSCEMVLTPGRSQTASVISGTSRLTVAMYYDYVMHLVCLGPISTCLDLLYNKRQQIESLQQIHKSCNKYIKTLRTTINAQHRNMSSCSPPCCTYNCCPTSPQGIEVVGPVAKPLNLAGSPNQETSYKTN